MPDATNGGADERDCSPEIGEHELRGDAHDAEACAAQFQITARIRAAFARVDGAINLNDEPDGGSKEVSDELTRERDLPTEGDAELARLEG